MSAQCAGVLGKSGSTFSQARDASILVSLDRSQHRDNSVFSENKYWQGVDIWTAYEFQYLNENQQVVSSILQLRLNARTPFYPESKSFKLYLHSLNDLSATRDSMKSMIRTDLSKVLKTDAFEIQLIEMESFAQSTFVHFAEDVINLDHQSSAGDFCAPLKVESFQRNTFQKYGWTGFKTQCPVTGQPDWAYVALSVEGRTHPEPGSLVSYLSSFRQQCHFHEETVEMVSSELWKALQPEAIRLSFHFSRRGGIDITPMRIITKEKQIEKGLSEWAWQRHVRQ